MKPTRVFCRLDFFLISNSIVNRIESSKIIPGYRSDHSFVKIKLITIQQDRGPGFWKLNCSLLKDIEYCNKVKEWIASVEDENENETSAKLLIELIKLKVRGETIKFSTLKKKMREHKINELERKILDFEKSLQNSTNNQDEIEKEIKNAKNEMEQYIAEKTKGAMIRSRLRWVEEGEKSTKYFFNLEKRNYNSKSLVRLKGPNNDIISDQKEILKEEKRFYEKLLLSEIIDADDDTFFQVDAPKLSENEKNELSKAISEQEISKAIRDCPNNKAPGADGFPIEFYKMFWPQLKHILVKLVSECYEEKSLHKTARLGLITLLPKPNKDLLFLKNWRPLTLLNCDYKIMAKIIATRLKKHLLKIIHTDQTGFIKGRYIGENIVKILDLIDYTQENDIPALLVAVDYEKAFDRLEWKIVQKALKYFNFPDYIANWVGIFYNKIESKVVNNGWATDTFYPTRGCRQGCPLSPYLFILVGEILALQIRNNKDIKGIKIGDTELKLSQYADDTTLSVLYDANTMTTLMNTFDHFEQISGLKVNYNKTEVLRIGSIRDSNAKLYTTKPLKWSDTGSLSLLGVNISVDKAALIDTNYTQIIEKIKDKISLWKKRKLTIYGRILIIKTLLFSQLIYRMNVLPFLKESHVKTLREIFIDYLWEGKPPPIAHSTMINDFDKGGARMIDIVCKEKAIKATWAARMYNNSNASWAKLAYMQINPTLGPIIWKCNISEKDADNLPINNTFWKNVLLSWCSYNYKEPLTKSEVKTQVLWYNSFLKVGGKLHMLKRAIKAGIIYVKDILHNNGTLLSLEEIHDRYGNCINQMQYNSLMSSIPKNWKQLLRNNDSKEKKNKIDAISKMPSICKYIYLDLINAKSTTPENAQEKWNMSLGINVTDWENIYSNIYMSTICTKFRDFQFRLLHRTLVTNKKLVIMKLSTNKKCTFCNIDTETIEHILYECQCCQLIWERLFNLVSQKTGLNIVSTKANVFFGIPLENNVPVKQAINTCLIISKQYIYACRCLNKIPNFHELLERIKFYQLIEYKIASKKDKVNKHNRKWESLKF